MNAEYGHCYVMVNTTNQKVYVGQAVTTDKHNWHRRCRSELNYPHNPHYKRAIEKAGAHAFASASLSVAYDAEELNRQEKHWIKVFDSTNPSKGYNKMDGGEHSKPSVETRKKMSEAQKRFNKLNANSFKGASHSDDARRKISESQAHRWKSYPALINVRTGERINAGVNVSQLCKQHGLNKPHIRAVIDGRKSQHKGWIVEQHTDTT